MGLTPDETASVTQCLERAEQAHAAWAVYQGGADANWASFYARFLVEQSPLADALVGHHPEGVHLDQVTLALRHLATDHAKRAPSAPWTQWYAAHLVAALRTAAIP